MFPLGTRLRKLLADNAEWLQYYPPRSVSRRYKLTKRCIDLALILVSSVVWLPVLILCALAIKLESVGYPVFFMHSS